MKNCLVKNGLIFLIIILFVFSSIIPMVVGYDVETTKEDDYLEKLAFVCSDRYGFSKLAYYEELLQRDYSNIDVVESEEIKILLESLPVATSGGPMDSAWPMKCHDLHHTSRSPYSTADNPYIEKWRFWEDRWMECSPIIDSDGTIYIGDAWGDLIAIYPNGTVKWKYTLGGQIMDSTPAIAEDGTIYVGSWDDYLYAINPDGTRKWRFLAHDNIASSPAIGDDGTIYFGTMGTGYNIYAVNPNGTEKWHYTTGYKIVSDPAISNDGTIYCGSGDSYLYAMYPNGTLRWRFKTGDEIHGHPSIAEDDTIYIGSYDSYLYALYPNGTMSWKCKVGYGTSGNPSIGYDGTIYVGANELYAIYPNGTVKWSFNFGKDQSVHKSSPAISADGTIYIGTFRSDFDGGFIIAVNPDGTERWSRKIAQYGCFSSPAIGEDGTVYIGTTEGVGKGGYLYAFGPQETNDPPTAPSITGPLTGKAGTSYDYKFAATDPDRNPVSYYVEWGDSTNTGWTDDYNTGEEITLSHAWSSDGTFTIKARARDTFGAEGPEESLTVTMPRNRAINGFFLRFLEHFPILQKILVYIL